MQSADAISLFTNIDNAVTIKHIHPGAFTDPPLYQKIRRTTALLSAAATTTATTTLLKLQQLQLQQQQGNSQTSDFARGVQLHSELCILT